MNCSFCQSELTDLKNGIFDCRQCPVELRYFCYVINGITQLDFLQFRTKSGHIIEINYTAPSCSFYVLLAEDLVHQYSLVTKLPTLPEITPTNAEQWMQRILDL